MDELNDATKDFLVKWYLKYGFAKVTLGEVFASDWWTAEYVNKPKVMDIAYLPTYAKNTVAFIQLTPKVLEIINERIK